MVIDHDTLRALRARLAFLAKREGSNNAFARRCGVDQGQMGRYISGDREPMLSTLIQIAERAGVTLEWLVAGVGPEKPAQKGEGDLSGSRLGAINARLLGKVIAIAAEQPFWRELDLSEQASLVVRTYLAFAAKKTPSAGAIVSEIKRAKAA